MALRTIRVEGDRVLRKNARPVTEVTEKETALIDDMLETMYNADGVGLAAPQVGILRQIVVMDVGEGPIVLINPEIVEREGEQIGDEGCLSLPGKVAEVKRPMRVVVKAYDRSMEPFTLEGTELLARCICHEVDHLSGHLYTDFAEGPVRTVESSEEEE